MEITFIQLYMIFSCVFISSIYSDDPNRLPTKCETCKYLTNEIAESFLRHDSTENIETGYNIDERLNKKQKTRYVDSELRLIEVFEEVCEGILKYNVHAERSGSLRYAKGESQTMGTLKGLRDRGVKVELGIPEDLWDSPSAEISNLKKYCDNMVELYEENIEEWYKNKKDDISLTDYLCDQRILKENEKECLTEVFDENQKNEKTENEKEPTEEDKKAKVESETKIREEIERQAKKQNTEL